VARSTARGSREVSLLPVRGSAGVLVLRQGSRADYIPADALPYLGRGLNPDLFSLAALRRAESGKRLPVRMTFSGRRPALPGVIVTRSGAGAASGYLTATSARRFGAALARQFRADHARARYGTDGLFARSLSLGLAGAPGLPSPARQASARAGFRLRALTVTGTDRRGRPDNGDMVVVMNAANWQRFGDPIESTGFFYQGVAKFAVPAGPYWAIGDFVNFSARSFAERLVVLPQFTVSKKHRRAHLAETAASSRLTIATALPTSPLMDGVTLVRGGLHGTQNSWGFFDSGGSLWISPTTARPSVGTLQTYTTAQLASPAHAAAPYFYNLDFPGPAGVIPPQNFAAPQGSLATVAEVYYQDRPSTGGLLTSGGTLAQWNSGTFTLVPSVPLPEIVTQYLTAGPSMIWQDSYVENINSFAGWYTDSFRTLPAGGRLTQQWNKYPLHPQPDVQLMHGAAASDFPAYPSAFRSGNTLWLSPNPFSDNQPGHTGSAYYGFRTKLAGSYAIDQNGRQIVHGNPFGNAGIKPARLSASPSRIRFTLATARVGGPVRLSPASDTVWTWRTRRQPGAHVPPSWYCGISFSGQQFRYQHRCAVQPMMTLAYQVSGMPLDGLTSPGRQEIGLSVGHVQLGGSAAITGASARVSYNSGRTWKAATVTAAGGGSFRIGFTAPPGALVTLRVHAADSAGGSITETILNAYGVRS